MRPVLRAIAATWKSGGLFKKRVNGIFFVWHPKFTDSSNAITLAHLNGFLNSNGLENPSVTVNWVGMAISNIDIEEQRQIFEDEQPWFGFDDLEEACDINYSLKAISFDKATRALVLKVEESDCD